MTFQPMSVRVLITVARELAQDNEIAHATIGSQLGILYCGPRHLFQICSQRRGCFPCAAACSEQLVRHNLGSLPDLPFRRTLRPLLYQPAAGEANRPVEKPHLTTLTRSCSVYRMMARLETGRSCALGAHELNVVLTSGSSQSARATSGPCGTFSPTSNDQKGPESFDSTSEHAKLRVTSDG